MDSPARDVADARRISDYREMEVDADKPAGEFSLKSSAAMANPRARKAPGPHDVALVLHTSGTTSRPKIVPLTHRNVTASAANIVRTLRLSREDLCLNIMPLFHIHGLIGAVLSSIAAGASIACAPNFDALKFFRWFAETRPTWFTAVPSMHQAILARAGRNTEIIAAGRLRLIRSSSAALAPQVMEELEKVFRRVPVLGSYGMTEAAHQMASNPLPPAPRFAGSVGIASGPEIGIVNEAGAILSANQIGEVVIRGINVTPWLRKIIRPPTPAAWIDGWFRTGDQGFLDDAGYLRLTGRLKELINRGGEKISPIEVEAVLLDASDGRPSGRTFATVASDARRGSRGGGGRAARRRVHPGEHQLREFVGARLAPFKVPRKIVFLDAIPKGPTGKPQRIGLAKTLGLES